MIFVSIFDTESKLFKYFPIGKFKVITKKEINNAVKISGNKIMFEEKTYFFKRFKKDELYVLEQPYPVVFAITRQIMETILSEMRFVVPYFIVKQDKDDLDLLTLILTDDLNNPIYTSFITDKFSNIIKRGNRNIATLICDFTNQILAKREESNYCSWRKMAEKYNIKNFVDNDIGKE